MSLRPSKTCTSPRTCSGDMYCGVPDISPRRRRLNALVNCQAEVGNTRLAVLVKQNIAGLEITMDKPTLMRSTHRFGNTE